MGYYYNLDVVNTASFDLFWGGTADPSCSTRTCHAVDLLYTWMPLGLDQYMDTETIDLTQSIMDYWFNFASNHDPNTGVSVDTEWPGIDDSENIMILDEELSTASISTDRVDICAMFDSVGYIAPYSYPDVDTTT